jgi:hypothetical protein
MPKCRKCPYHCKPCLTLEEAEGILQSNGRAWEGNTICQQCHNKGNRKHNEALGQANEKVLEQLEKEIAKLQKELAKYDT